MARILFISNLWYESLALMQLSAVAKKDGHKIDLYMDNGKPKRLLRYISKVKPDLIGFSLMTGQHLWALRIATFLKQYLNHKSLIIFGGPHPTFAPEIIECDAVDIVCRGEGENALLDLLNTVSTKNDFSRIPNLWVKQNGEITKNEIRPLIKDLDSLPFLDREIFYKYSYFRDSPIRMVMASRGCPFNCSFCFNEKYRNLYRIPSSYVRRRTYRNVIEEIKLLKTKYKKTRIIKFHDDIFTLDKQWLYEFLDIYKREIKLPFMCYVRAGVDEGIIRRLAEAGCRRIGFGIETGDENLRNNILKKAVSNQQIYDLARLLKKYKVPFFTNTIFFVPQETIPNVWETVRINQTIKPNYVANHIFQLYPGTSISENLMKADLIQNNYLESLVNMYALPPFALKNKDEINTKMNIYYFYAVLVKLPFLKRIIDPLVKLKPNILFLAIFKITAGLNHYLRNGLSFSRFLREACHNIDYK